VTPFQPLPWQQARYVQLRRLQREGQLGHALLISGSEGLGKRAFAWALIAAGLCDTGGDTACGQCPACLKLQAGAHPDAGHLQRQVDEKTGKLRRDIRIEQVRELIEQLGLASHYGRGRYTLIDPVEALNEGGRNALLKTLEEPPAGNHLLLISERPQALPATIRSRCQSLRFAPPEAAAAQDWCREQQIDAEMLALAGGAPLLAQRWQQSQQAAVFRRWDSSWKAVAADRTPPLRFAAEIGREEIPEFLQWVLRWFHQHARSGLQQDGVNASMRSWSEVYDEAVAAPALLARNVPGQLVVESLLIGWWRAMRLAARGVQSSGR
jgi:DNA polymerase III subunit delta'